MPSLVTAEAGPTEEGATAGWFGKLPSVGDFVTRRLPPSFVEPWDRWLQSGIASARNDLGDQWDELYLTFPVWRFLLPCGILGDCGWAGILLPSVDRVGRHFPLTLAAPLTPEHRQDLGLAELEHALQRFEEAGLLGLDDTPLEDFDREVRKLCLPGLVKPDPLSSLTGQPDLPPAHLPPTHQLRFEGDLASALARHAGRRLLAQTSDRIVWWLPGQGAGGGTIRLDRWPFPESAFEQLILQD